MESLAYIIWVRYNKMTSKGQELLENLNRQVKH